MRRFLSFAASAAIVAALAGPVFGQSRVLDRSAPLRFDTNTLQVAWPSDANSFWNSNAVVRSTSSSASLAGNASVASNLTAGGSAQAASFIVLGSKTGTLDIAVTGSGTSSLVLVIGNTTNIIKENVQ